MLNIALPKGRLGEKVYALLKASGYTCAGMEEDNRKLVYENSEIGIRYFMVKPGDVATYVERGAADIGVVGKDVILEQQPDIYELSDLGLGKCRMCVAALCSFREDKNIPLRVATKYPNIAQSYYKKLDREIEIIKLHGSIELAPITGLSDVIVDIVETGSTLKENDLKVFSEILSISARLIANKSSYHFKQTEIDRLKNTIGKGETL